MKLDTIKVIDLSLFLPGPHLSMMMADHGAEVIKIEPAHEPDPAREIGFRHPASKHSVWFRNTNRGKKSLRLDLKAPEGRELLLKLAESADVFIEAFRPGVMARLGIDYETVARRNPKIVYCSISAFGQDGRYRLKPAHDLAVEAMAGVVSLGLGQDGKPAAPPLTVADMIVSSMALSAILMALLRREKTGQGDYIDLAMHDALLAWTPNVSGRVFAEDRAPDVPNERIWGGAAMYRIYGTADGKYLALGGSEPKFAANLLKALGRPDLIPAACLPPGPGQKPVIDFLTATFATRALSQWEAFLEPLDVCFAPVRDLKAAFDDPNTYERGMRLKDADGMDHIGIPMRFKNEPGRVDFRLPDYGADSETIAASLGFDPAALKAKNVI